MKMIILSYLILRTITRDYCVWHLKHTTTSKACKLVSWTYSSHHGLILLMILFAIFLSSPIRIFTSWYPAYFTSICTIRLFILLLLFIKTLKTACARCTLMFTWSLLGWLLHIAQTWELWKLLLLLLIIFSGYDEIVNIVIIDLGAVIDSRVGYVTTHIVYYIRHYLATILLCISGRLSLLLLRGSSTAPLLFLIVYNLTCIIWFGSFHPVIVSARFRLIGIWSVLSTLGSLSRISYPWGCPRRGRCLIEIECSIIRTVLGSGISRFSLLWVIMLLLLKVKLLGGGFLILASLNEINYIWWIIVS